MNPSSRIATSHLGPKYNYKTPSILTGQHPEIVVRLDMYEHAFKEGLVPANLDPSAWNEDVAGAIDIDDHLIIPANAGYQKFCAAIEQHLRKVLPYTGMSYIDLLESDCPFYVDEHGVDIWHKGPANDVHDDKRGDNAPTFDPDPENHHIGVSVLWKGRKCWK